MTRSVSGAILPLGNSISCSDIDPRLTVAVLDEEIPFPPVTGKRIRTLNLLKRLCGDHQVIFVCRRNSDPEEAERAAESLRQNLFVTVDKLQKMRLFLTGSSVQAKILTEPRVPFEPWN